MEDMVVPGVLNDGFVPQRTYPEKFVLIAQSKVCQERGVKKGGGTWRMLRVLTGDMENMVVPDVLNDVFYPKEDTLKISC